MVKGKRKPLEEIKATVSRYKRILITGCGGCVSVCLAGGQREVEILSAELKSEFKKESAVKRIDGFTVERQCNMQMLSELDDIINEYDAVLSMACGAGVQYTAERFPKVPVFPAINTMAIGVDRELGVYEEKCRACGECVLAYTGGICPVTSCAKGLFNGPCGGTNNGACEISDDIPCAWNEIYNRLKEQNRLEDIIELQMPMQWKNQIKRIVVQDLYNK
ncbi:MAG: methylenetetrahydrofolate reductase C-terminal domain-containing protein [Deltaproteobacteria bacterium]|nr:methylenetetrahydrofolate reductase C-terminal domain-containing protein [Deltaproteobacteria bacterium]